MDSRLISEMNRGYLQLVVLSCLDEQIHGYRLIKKLKSIGYNSIEANTMYPLLCRFEKKGWVVSEWVITTKQPQKQYVITAEGKKVRAQLDDVWQEQCELMNRLKGAKNE